MSDNPVLPQQEEPAPETLLLGSQPQRVENHAMHLIRYSLSNDGKTLIIRPREPIAPLLGQDDPMDLSKLSPLPEKEEWEDWSCYWSRCFETRTRDLRKALTSLAAMTEDRNLWQGEHNEDCPNLASLAEAQKRITELTKELGR